MSSALPPPKGRYSSGPVWCERRGRSAVVSLVTPVDGTGGPYVQWCSLVGTNIVCDERCVCRGAKWAARESATATATALNRKTYDPLRDVVVQVRERIEGRSLSLECWVRWASAFTAGISSGPRAWRAAEEARREAVRVEQDVPARRVVLAAEDAAWAAVHAAAGNQALALQCAVRARQLLGTAAKGSFGNPA